QARGLHGGNMYEDIRTTVVGLDETEALFGVEEFYGASFGHASGPFLSARILLAGSITVLPLGAFGRQFSTFEERVLFTAGLSGVPWNDGRRPPGICASPAAIVIRSSRVRKLPEQCKSAVFMSNWQAKVFLPALAASLWSQSG